MTFKAKRDAGSALVIVLPAAVLLLALTTSMITVGNTTKGENEASRQSLQSLYLAEAGVSKALAELTAGNSGTLGSSAVPVKTRQGTFHTAAIDIGSGRIAVTSTGASGNATRTVRALIAEVPGGIFHNAIFAGNSSGDPSYSFELGGVGGAADLITGDIYSGQDVSITGDSSVSGTIRAEGEITGAVGEEDAQPQPIPDLAAQNYDVNNDVDVAAEFAAHAAEAASDLGGTAWQVPEEHASHIFRLNPSDRQSEFLATAKNDYFLEDPYEPVNSSATVTPAGSTVLSLSGTGGKPGPNGNEQLYFIDGNLWVHNLNAFSFRIDAGAGAAVKVVFVVKGNIYFSDNVICSAAETDGIGFIALKDQDVSDSGNIYFGDPVFGTLEQMDGFMYAENDFLDQNLNVGGSENVIINGIMTAGNQVKVLRPDEGPRTQLVVNFDDRVKEGALALPGLPAASNGFRIGYKVISVTEVLVDPVAEVEE